VAVAGTRATAARPLALAVLTVHSWLLQGECTLPPDSRRALVVLVVHLWLVQGYRRA